MAGRRMSWRHPAPPIGKAWWWPANAFDAPGQNDVVHPAVRDWIAPRDGGEFKKYAEASLTLPISATASSGDQTQPTGSSDSAGTHMSGPSISRSRAP